MKQKGKIIFIENSKSSDRYWTISKTDPEFDNSRPGQYREERSRKWLRNKPSFTKVTFSLLIQIHNHQVK